MIKRVTVSLLFQMMISSSSILLKSIVRLTKSDISRTATLIHNAFPLEGTHSWARAVGMKQSNLEYWLREEYLQKPISEDIGCYGISKGDELLGVIINERFPLEEDKLDDIEEDEFLKDAYSSFDALLDAGKEIVRNKLKQKGLPDKNIGYIAWIASQEQYRGQGIADELISKSCSEMINNNYKHCIAFCVSPTATRVFSKRDFIEWGDINYKNFQHKGKNPFAILPDSMTIMVKELK